MYVPRIKSRLLLIHNRLLCISIRLLHMLASFTTCTLDCTSEMPFFIFSKSSFMREVFFMSFALAHTPLRASTLPM